jgi:hypothetical protein
MLSPLVRRLLFVLLVLMACHTQAAPTTSGQPEQSSVDVPLQKRLLSGKATLADIRQAMSNPNIGELANAIHALYSMSWHRGAHSVLLAMWRNSPADQQEFPELAWEPIAKPAVRIALASTLNRYYPADPQYRTYLRAHINDTHEFHRAQAAVGLGLNHDPADVETIVKLAQEDNVMVAQSAITALALMDEEKARQALVELQKQYADHPKGRLIREVLQRAYRKVPSR